MEFKKLHNTSTCNCIDKDCKINTEDFFYRRLTHEKPTEFDFESWEEMGRTPRQPNPKCKVICDFKALSLSKHVDYRDIEEFYAVTKELKPSLFDGTPFYCKVKFTSTCGKLKPSPSTNDTEHYSFFKSDNFDFEKIIINIKPIK